MKSIEKKPQSWRVISIEFQNCETLHAPLFHNLCLKNLHTAFDDTECHIYWIQPSFILVFFQGRALPIEKCVEEFLRETEFKGFGRFFDILDLSIHWSDLINMTSRICDFSKKVVPPLNIPRISEPLRSRPTVQDDVFTVELCPKKIRQMRPTRAGRDRPLLLLVEDDPFTLQLVKLAMKDMFDIIAAETARQALSFYQRHLPDMVFLDIQLPDGNGINILKEITAADDDSYAVMLSSHAQKEKIIGCLSYGAKNFIAKPFTRQRLLDAAIKYLDTRKNVKVEGTA